ncbi:hypothetical protein [Thermococcus sp. MAR1]|uniref:hypothetical protein n=1 Tax=Thermococcus sp. MAR1 TaxID=1638263 RepID=UPI00143C3F76|nr:hypothetical protein [Thermococcus sp. MAR1]NJE09349.1 hypothetical protein [Thermococcus sp. MAR1]
MCSGKVTGKIYRSGSGTAHFIIANSQLPAELRGGLRALLGREKPVCALVTEKGRSEFLFRMHEYEYTTDIVIPAAVASVLIEEVPVEAELALEGEKAVVRMKKEQR